MCVCVCVCVLNSKEMLRPRLSAKAFSLLQNNANWGDDSKEHESVISLMAAEYPDPLDDRQVFDVAERPVESLHVQNEVQHGRGLPAAMCQPRAHTDTQARTHAGGRRQRTAGCDLGYSGAAGRRPLQVAPCLGAPQLASRQPSPRAGLEKAPEQARATLRFLPHALVLPACLLLI